MKNLAVYGSLRKGDYNYERFKRGAPDEVNHVKTVEVEGFTLHDLGVGYPCAIPAKGKLVVDILEVSDEAHRSIKIMEEGAGYKEEQIQVDGIDAVIYVYEKTNAPIVESGDWIKHKYDGNPPS